MSDFGAAGLPALAQRSVRDLVLAGRAAIDEAGSFDQVREIAAKADALRAYQRSIGASQVALNAAGELKLRAERRMGEALAEAPKATGGDRAGRAPIGGNRQIPPITPPTLAEIGVTKVQSSRYQHIAAIPADTFDAAIEAHNRVGEPISAAGVARVADALGDLPPTAKAELVAIGEAEIVRAAKEIKVAKAQVRRAENNALKAMPTPLPVGRYGTVVIDPPWDMEKIEREVRPNQVAFDYPTMTEDELAAFRLADMAAEDCHLFCWTTQRFLPMALRLIEVWGFRYVLTMVWHKPGGFQPIGLPQYNCEFAIYARRGSPRFVDTKAFPCAFSAARREHSRKPDEFYDTIRRVTPEGRIDVFSREQRAGFSQHGNEASKFGDAA